MSSIFPNTATATSPADVETDERVQINLDEEVEVENPEGDFNERTAPPPASKCQAFRWTLGDKGVVPGTDKNKKTFLGVHLKAEVINLEGFEGYTTNYYLNSIIFRGKTTSELHHFMNAIGHPLPKMTLGKMKETVEEALAQTPVAYAETEWKTGYQGTENDPKTNKPKWVDQYIRMDQFPLVDDPENPGKRIRSFEAKSAKNGESIYAQYYIKRILSPSEAQKLKGGS